MKGAFVMPVYNKLVRDRIPEIIQQDGKIVTSRILDDAMYLKELNKKMHEELAEYEDAKTNEEAMEELADLLELIHAATAVYGGSFDQLEKIRLEKAEKRGSFNERIFLMEVQDD